MNVRSLRSRGARFGKAGLVLGLVAATVAVAPVAVAQVDDDSEAVQFTFENLQPADGFFFTEP